jgi:electron transport complex protein RnfG
MKKMIRLGIILMLYCVVASMLLAVVYNVTAKIIADRRTADLQAALTEVFPSADSFEPVTGLTSGNPHILFLEAFSATADGAAQGVAVKAQGPSYGGSMTILVGVSTQSSITGVKVLENKDTPGLGSNASASNYYVQKESKTTFAGQFTGKKLTDAFEVKKDVIAITSATITSSAVTSMVQAVAKAAADFLGIGAAGPVPGDALPAADAIRQAAKPAISNSPDVVILETYVGTKAGAIVGAIARVRGKGYDGQTTAFVGVSLGGTIAGVIVLETTDSLGSKILSPTFAAQFVGKKASDPLSIGSGIDAVAGATFSSAGASAMVKAAAQALATALAGGGV